MSNENQGTWVKYAGNRSRVKYGDKGASGLSSDDIKNDSVVTGKDVTEALDSLNATAHSLSNDTPVPVGPPTPGIGNEASRDDHVHAHGDQAGGSLHADATPAVDGFMTAADKTKLDASGELSDTVPQQLGGASAGTGTESSRNDHVHAHGDQAGGSLHADATTVVDGFMTAADKTKLDASGELSNVAPQQLGATSAGTGTEASRNDHVHAHGDQAGGSLHADATTVVDGFMTAADKTKLDASGELSDAAPQQLGGASAGTGTQASRDDHVHAHGDQAGGSLHADATPAVDGFMTAADKTKLNAINVPAYGEMYEDTPGAPSNIVCANINQWYPWINAGVGRINSLVAFNSDDTNGDNLEIQTNGDGDFIINISGAFSGTVNTDWEIYLFKNNVFQQHIGTLRVLGTGGDVGSISASGMLALVATDYLSIKVRCTSQAAATFGLENMNLSIHRV